MTEHPPRVWWSSGNLIVAHRYGGCYDVVQIGDTGCDVVEEISTLPSDAVEYRPVPAAKDLPTVRRSAIRKRLEKTRRRFWEKGGEVNMRELVDQAYGAVAECGVRCADDDFEFGASPTAACEAESTETVERAARVASLVFDPDWLPGRPDLDDWDRRPDWLRVVRAVAATLGVELAVDPDSVDTPEKIEARIQEAQKAKIAEQQRTIDAGHCPDGWDFCEGVAAGQEREGWDLADVVEWQRRIINEQGGCPGGRRHCPGWSC